MKQDMIPWHDADAIEWLSKMKCWTKMARLIQGTLKQDPNTYPHQMRAAVAMVLMIGREGLWPTGDSSVMPLHEVVALARRQLAHVKQRFSLQSRRNRDLLGNPVFKALLGTLDDEIRILEARNSDPKTVLSDKPPGSWQNFWSEKFPNVG